MDLETIKARIRNLDIRISNENEQIKTVSTNLDEAKDALKSAKKLQAEFDAFVSHHKQARDNNIFENSLKSFQSFLNKTQRMLTGAEYNKANGNVEEMIRISSQEINKLDEDLMFCRRELSRLKEEKEELMAEYKALLAESEGGAET